MGRIIIDFIASRLRLLLRGDIRRYLFVNETQGCCSHGHLRGLLARIGAVCRVSVLIGKWLFKHLLPGVIRLSLVLLCLLLLSTALILLAVVFLALVHTIVLTF